MRSARRRRASGLGLAAIPIVLALWSAGCVHTSRGIVIGGVDGLVEQKARGNLAELRPDIERAARDLSRGAVDGALEAWDDGADARAAELEALVDRFMRTIEESAVTVGRDTTAAIRAEVVVLIHEALDAALDERHRDDLDALVTTVTRSLTDTVMRELSRGLEDDLGPALANTLRDDVGPALGDVLRDDVTDPLGDGVRVASGQAVLGVADAVRQIVDEQRQDENSLWAKLLAFLDGGRETLDRWLLLAAAVFVGLSMVFGGLLIYVHLRRAAAYQQMEESMASLELVTQTIQLANERDSGAMRVFKDVLNDLAPKGKRGEGADASTDPERRRRQKARGTLEKFLFDRGLNMQGAQKSATQDEPRR